MGWLACTACGDKEIRIAMKLCLTPRVHGVGGMVSFAAKLTAGLNTLGISTQDDLHSTGYDTLLVIGGTRDLPGLWRARRRGVRIVQRLNGMNWIHRIHRTGWRHFLRAEYGNFILATIRSRLADHIVYQSEFARGWWERVYGPTRIPSSVIYNGVDLNAYSPDGPSSRPLDHYRLLLVEGSLGGGYEMGLETAVQLAEVLSRTQNLGKPVELMVVGRVAADLQARWQQQAQLPLQFTGLVPRERIPEIDRSAHLLYSADVNAACPNSAIEALACGLPVVGFDTGALPELASGDAGRIVPYGRDVWRLEAPDINGLAGAVAEILADPERFRIAARARAEQAFGLDRMTTAYLQVLAKPVS
jgi:glycosyltransferase involved in cell wall biosynthesis